MILKIQIRVFVVVLSCLLKWSSIYACSDVTGLYTTSITHSSATLNWNPTSCDSFLVRYYITGTTYVHFKIVSPGTALSVTIDSLYPNTNYCWLIHSYCSGGQSGGYQATPATFSTINGIVSCYPANQLSARNITNTSANVAWNYLIDADSFLVRYHVSGSANFTWRYIQGIYHSVTLPGLSPSTIYEWDVKTICNGNLIPSNYSDTFVTNCDTLPVPDHIVICIMENKGFQQIIDSIVVAPYINALANDPMSALFTQSYALEHPSQPDYLDLFAGSNQGVTTNNVPAPHFITPNLARELLDAGKTFVSYSENLPYTGSDTIRSGNYERKHNPVANWMGTGTNQVPATCNQPFTNFPTDFHLLPTVSYVVPDQIGDMHSSPIDTGDAWVETHMDAYVQWAKANNSLFILTFDEDNHAYNNRIVTIFCGPMVRGGEYPKYMNHYSLLRTIEDMYTLGHAGHAGAIESVKECWLAGFTGVAEHQTPSLEWSIYGFAGTGELNIDYTLPSLAKVSFEVFSEDGKTIYIESSHMNSPGIHRVIINPDNRPSNGFYIVRLTVDENTFSKKTVMVY